MVSIIENMGLEGHQASPGLTGKMRVLALANASRRVVVVYTPSPQCNPIMAALLISRPCTADSRSQPRLKNLKKKCHASTRNPGVVWMHSNVTKQQEVLQGGAINSLPLFTSGAAAAPSDFRIIGRLSEKCEPVEVFDYCSQIIRFLIGYLPNSLL